MRNETEFKTEVIARFDKKKKEIKKRRQTLAATLPALALVLILSAVFLSQSFGIIPNTESFDGAAEFSDEITVDNNDGADGSVGTALGESESTKIDILDVTDNEQDLSTNTAGNSTVKDESADIFSLSRIYSDKKKIDGFKALLGVWEEIFSEEENKAHATGAVITLLTEEMTEKYILNNKEIYTADMQKYIPLDEKEYEEIRKYLTENPSDK